MEVDEAFPSNKCLFFVKTAEHYFGHVMLDGLRVCP